MNFGINQIMVAKAAIVKKIQLTCEITDPPWNKHFLIKNISNQGSGLVFCGMYLRLIMAPSRDRTNAVSRPTAVAE